MDYRDNRYFPDPRDAPSDEPMVWGGELTARTLLLAYRQGIFPWYGEWQPILWWCPDPRFVLYPEELKVSRSLAKTLRHSHWRITFDQSFTEVMKACATSGNRRQEGTWITPAMLDAYCDLHRRGYAHSVECWEGSRLIGGLYGVAIGRVFFGESMFYHHCDASKVALVSLVRQLKAWGFAMVDCQQPTEHMARFGARAITRDVFLDQLALAVDQPPVENWRFSHCADKDG